MFRKMNIKNQKISVKSGFVPYAGVALLPPKWGSFGPKSLLPNLEFSATELFPEDLNRSVFHYPSLKLKG